MEKPSIYDCILSQPIGTEILIWSVSKKTGREQKDILSELQSLAMEAQSPVKVVYQVWIGGEEQAETNGECILKLITGQSSTVIDQSYGSEQPRTEVSPAFYRVASKEEVKAASGAAITEQDRQLLEVVHQKLEGLQAYLSGELMPLKRQVEQVASGGLKYGHGKVLSNG